MRKVLTVLCLLVAAASFVVGQQSADERWAAAIAELEAVKAELETDLAAVTTERDALLVDNAGLTAQVADLTAERDALATQLAAITPGADEQRVELTNVRVLWAIVPAPAGP